MGVGRAHVQSSSTLSTLSTLPIVVDLDGTLTPTDTLVESTVNFVKTYPFKLPRLLFWIATGRQRFKQALATHSSVAVHLLPYRESLLTYLRDEKAKGRPIILATAAHEDIAHRVATHLGLFDSVLASDDRRNLKGLLKLEEIRQKVGPNFVYAGDSRVDIPIWKNSKGAILVTPSRGLADSIRDHVPIEREFTEQNVSLGVWLKALRIHQWSKNLLLFVPLLTAFSFLDLRKITSAMLAFLAFSLSASATYIFNDLWDLQTDRAHPRKRLRPLASGQIPIVRAVFVGAIAALCGFYVALHISQGFAVMLLLYFLLTGAYSFRLKRYVLMDVVVLSLLYTLRILAGSVATHIPTSSWLLAFSVFIFLSLALVKRCGELVSLSQNEKKSAVGRDYSVSDLAVLWPLGVGAAISAIVIFGLFISAPETQGRYATPQLLWLVAIGLIYWISRLWIKTSRGEMHDDPIIYAVTDRGSRIIITLIMATVILAHFLTLPIP